MRGENSVLVFWLFAALAIAAWIAWNRASAASKEKSEHSKSRAELSALRREQLELQQKYSRELAEYRSSSNAIIAKKDFLVEGLTKIIEQRKSQFPWLASAFADLGLLVAMRDADHLERKKHPAKKAADEVREYGRKKRQAERELRILRYRAEYYEKLFPWISNYVGDDVPDSAVDVSGYEQGDQDDPARSWLSEAEYTKLPNVEKYQKALENWTRRKKSNWEIGRDYERYVGYLYETQGYEVQFTGAIDGFADMGRDVIARRGSQLVIVQCKYWASHKEIHEKHIFQLFGSSLEYAFRFNALKIDGVKSLFDNPSQKIGLNPVLYTSTKLSGVAKEVARKLNVQFHELARISDYPLIKCNVSERNRERIYHLPFDQQYDRVKISRTPEMYAYTVAEAEKAGFRRAWRWQGS
ncbi:MAG: restriction endonuclease [Pseudomonadota bacterium]|nr:restriction endonuclease [Afipia sp.]